MLPPHRPPQNLGLPPSSPTPRTHPSSPAGDQDREYKGSSTLHVERPKFNERKRFSSYGEYKKIWKRPIKDQLFKKRAKQSFATGEVGVLGVGDPTSPEDMSVVSTTGLGSHEEDGAKEVDVVGREETCRSKSTFPL